MDTQKLTVFTPAYNRAHTLPRTYESLCRQSCKDFVWLIVDDGSSDGTRALVEEWQTRDNGFPIRYIYKENGGMHTAHNVAYDNITTELNTCIDSDDALAEGAVEVILSLWERAGGPTHPEIAGIIGLDADMNTGKVIGTAFPANMTTTTLEGFYASGGRGDKKLVYRTDVMRQMPPYPVFPGEKYISLGYKYQLCDQLYRLLTINRVLCNVEYQPDGSSHSMFRQYLRNPRGFAFIRVQNMKFNKSFRRNARDCVHYVSSCLIAREKHFVRKSPKPVLTWFSVPAGVLLTLYIRWRAKR